MALVILAHPGYDASLVNKTIVTELEKNGTAVEVRNLAALYPDFKIDVAAEQEALLRHRTVIFQFPVFWYNMPAILKQWFDNVFTYGFAFGSTGDKLKGKNFVPSISFGSPESEYQPLGAHHFRPCEFWKNMEQTAYLAQMNWQQPIHTNDSMAMGDTGKEADIRRRATEHAARVSELVKKLEA